MRPRRILLHDDNHHDNDYGGANIEHIQHVEYHHHDDQHNRSTNNHDDQHNLKHNNHNSIIAMRSLLLHLEWFWVDKYEQYMHCRMWLPWASRLFWIVCGANCFC